MEKHLSIFDDLYDIKDNISDSQFLILNNKIKNLVQENKNFRKFLKTNQVSYDVLFLEEEYEDSEEEISIDIGIVCSCSTRYVFPNILDHNEDISDYFCLNSQERMMNCENLKRLIEKLPLLENLYRKIDLPFIEEPIYNEYIKDEIRLIMKILLFLIEKVPIKRNKSIISFVLFDFMIKNINFMKDYQIFITTLLDKLQELITDEEYIIIASEFNVNYTKWIDIMKSMISEE
jgi:hypothetical protein